MGLWHRRRARRDIPQRLPCLQDILQRRQAKHQRPVAATQPGRPVSRDSAAGGRRGPRRAPRAYRVFVYLVRLRGAEPTDGEAGQGHDGEDPPADADEPRGVSEDGGRGSGECRTGRGRALAHVQLGRVSRAVAEDAGGHRGRIRGRKRDLDSGAAAGAGAAEQVMVQRGPAHTGDTSIA